MSKQSTRQRTRQERRREELQRREAERRRSAGMKRVTIVEPDSCEPCLSRHR